MSVLAEAGAQFALDLLRLVEMRDEVCLSPVSVAAALGMTYAGAEGTTAKEIRENVFRGLTEESVHEGFSKIVTIPEEPRREYQLNTENRLYSQRNFKILDEFLSIIASFYQSDMKEVNFEEKDKNRRERAQKSVNNWVAQVTWGKIKKFIPVDNARLMIINTIRLKGRWKETFEKGDSIRDTFYSAPNRNPKAMKPAGSKFLYGETSSVQVLGIPYKEDLVMFVFLPKDRFGLRDFEQQLTGSRLLSLITRTREAEVTLEMPKFRLEQRFNLNVRTLKKMGVEDMFIDGGADFSKVTGEKNLHVSHIAHKAFIQVTEKGTEAAAATSVVEDVHRDFDMELWNLWMHTPRSHFSLTFIADHPFLFLIVNQRNNVPLFIGRLVKPTSPSEEELAFSDISRAASTTHSAEEPPIVPRFPIQFPRRETLLTPEAEDDQEPPQDELEAPEVEVDQIQVHKSETHSEELEPSKKESSRVESPKADSEKRKFPPPAPTNLHVHIEVPKQDAEHKTQPKQDFQKRVTFAPTSARVIGPCPVCKTGSLVAVTDILLLFIILAFFLIPLTFLPVPLFFFFIPLVAPGMEITFLIGLIAICFVPVFFIPLAFTHECTECPHIERCAC